MVEFYKKHFIYIIGTYFPKMFTVQCFLVKVQTNYNMRDLVLNV